MDPVSPAVGASVIAGGASIIQGQAGAASQRAQAKAAEIEARYADLRAKQIGAQRTEEINDVVASVNLIRANRGAGLDSATGRAIRKDRRKRGREARRAEILGIKAGRDSSLARASYLRSQSKVTETLGFINAASDFAQAGADWE